MFSDVCLVGAGKNGSRSKEPVPQVSCGAIGQARANQSGWSPAPASCYACLLDGRCCKQREGEIASKVLMKCMPRTVHALEMQKCIPRLGV